MYVFKKISGNYGINETNRIENINKYLKKMLISSSITVAELVLRFLCFEKIFNKQEQSYIEEKNLY